MSNPAKPRYRKISGMTIERIISFLKGIAKENWLSKWARWIDELLDTYRVEDVQDVLGITDVWNFNELEQFLLEHCSDLVESECFDKIEQMIREKGYTKELTKEATQQIEDYLKSIEKAPEILYGLPWDIQAEISKYRAKPEMDHARAYNIVYEFLRREGVDESEARRIAEEIASTIPKLKPEKRAEVVTNVVAMVRLAKQTTLNRFAKAETKAREVKAKAVRDVEESVKLIHIPFSELPKYVRMVLEARNTRTPSDTIRAIEQWARSQGFHHVLVPYTLSGYDLTDIVIVYYPDKKPSICAVSRDNTWVLLGCDQPIIAYQIDLENRRVRTHEYKPLAPLAR